MFKFSTIIGAGMLLAIGTAGANAEWYHVDRIPAKPEIVLVAPTGHLGTKSRWCEWVEVTIKYDWSDEAVHQRMFGCD